MKIFLGRCYKLTLKVLNFRPTSKNFQTDDLKVVHKPQMVDLLPKFVKGNVQTLMEGVDERGAMDEVMESLELKPILKKRYIKVEWRRTSKSCNCCSRS